MFTFISQLGSNISWGEKHLSQVYVIHFPSRGTSLEDSLTSPRLIINKNYVMLSCAHVVQLAAIHRSDGAIIVSPFERGLLMRHHKVDQSKLLLAPFLYPQLPHNNARTTTNDYDSRKNFCTIGTFRHAPNVDAFWWLRDNIWPRIRKEIPSGAIKSI